MRFEPVTLEEVAQELEREPLHVLTIDTETTGLGYRDEVLELAIADGNRFPRVWKYYRPERVKKWPVAEEINGISPDYVRVMGRFRDDGARIAGILNQAHVVVGYNLDFDMRLMSQSGLPDFGSTVRTFDIMHAFAEIYGELLPPSDEGIPLYRWQKLETAARYYGVNWDHGRQHTALGDAIVTLDVLKAMIKAEAREA